jgi:hypothetical protein
MIVGHKPLTDSDIQDEIFNSLKCIDSESVAIDTWKSSVYFDLFKDWIIKSSKNTVQGLDEFQYQAYCAGTYDGIQSFIHRHATTRRIRFSRAEFVGSKIVSNNARANWCYLEDAPLHKDDAVILSLPFSGNGSYYPTHDQLLNTCSNLGIPVLLDLAYFGISTGINFDFSHTCITDVVCSLSKPMSTQLRLGLRLTRQFHDDALQALSDTNTYNRIAVSVGINLLKKFSHDWLIDRYVSKQYEICKQFDIDPTPTITLAIGNQKNYGQFWREGYYRICITDELQHNI